MTQSHDSRRPRRTRRQLTAAALVLLAIVGWALGWGSLSGGTGRAHAEAM